MVGIELLATIVIFSKIFYRIESLIVDDDPSITLILKIFYRIESVKDHRSPFSLPAYMKIFYRIESRKT